LAKSQLTQSSCPTHRAALVGWLPEIALLLVYFATRLYRLDEMPIFVDEVSHIHWAQGVWQLKVLHFIGSGRLLNVWLIALLIPFNCAGWVGRSLGALAGAVSLSGIYKMGQILLDRRAGLLGGLLYVLAPFTFFHDRLALSDPVAAAAGAALLVVSLMLVRRPTRGLVALTGVALAAALLVKAPMLAYLPVPILTALWLRRKRPVGLAQLGGVYLLAALLIAPVMGLGATRANLAGGVSIHSTFELASMVGRAAHNTQVFASDMWGFLTPPLCALMVGASGLALASRRRGAWWLLAAAALPIAPILVVARAPYTRYYLIGFPALFALAGCGISMAWGAARNLAPPGIVRLVSVGLLMGVAVLPASFFVAAYRDAATLSLPRSDYFQYVASYSSGYGWREAATWLVGRAGSGRTLDVMTLAEGYEWRLQITLYGVPNVRLFHARTLPADWLLERVGDSDTEVYLLLDTPKNKIDWTRYNVQPVRVGVYPRPGNLSAVEVYRLDPP
jgi:4-amino-4-deoxy-L-arabinose transferase-like glycosyltransferase